MQIAAATQGWETDPVCGPIAVEELEPLPVSKERQVSQKTGTSDVASKYTEVKLASRDNLPNGRLVVTVPSGKKGHLSHNVHKDWNIPTFKYWSRAATTI